MKAVLFICLGNICRSPTAEAVFKTYTKNAGLDLRIDSAGTGGWHQGEPPDERAMETGARRGYSFAGQTSRKIENLDFGIFDLILAMDAANVRDLRAICPSAYKDKIKLFLDYANLSIAEVPDPYYGGANGFDDVLNLIEAASAGLIKTLQAGPNR